MWVCLVTRHALVLRVPREKFFQFSWRPRAPSLLSEEQEREIQRNLKTHYSRRYDEEDLAALHEVCCCSFSPSAGSPGSGVQGLGEIGGRCSCSALLRKAHRDVIAA